MKDPKPDHQPPALPGQAAADHQRFRKKVSRAIRDFSMFTHRDKIAVALSGGKDSLTLLLLLKELNYQVEAFHIQLGIEKYSQKSLAFVKYQCDEYGVKLHTLKATEFAGFGVDETTANYPGQQCGICGSIKRQIFNRFALDHGFDVLAVGHNMDDEVEMLLGNNLRWDFSYLKKSYPVLAAREGFVKRVKPLCYLREADIKSYVKAADLQVLHCQCPHSAHGSRRKYHKILDYGSSIFPDFVESYYRNFLSAWPQLAHLPDEPVELKPCPHCQELTVAGLCRLCAVKAGLWRK